MEELPETIEKVSGQSFHIGLNIKMEAEDIQEHGTPDQWKWDKILDTKLGATGSVEVQYFHQSSSTEYYINDDGDLVEESTQEIVKIPSYGSIINSVDKVLGVYNDYIVDLKQDGGFEGRADPEMAVLRDVTDFMTRQLGDHFEDNLPLLNID